MSGARGLIADIGGTHARFGLIDDKGRIVTNATYPCADFADPAAAARAHADAIGLAAMPTHAALAVAGPVSEGRCTMTNHSWVIDGAAFGHTLGIPNVHLVNDFETVALGLPDLAEDDFLLLQAGAPMTTTPALVLGPGTGLGVAVLAAAGDGGRLALATEGGHATVATRDAKEASIVQQLTARFGHVSWERVLSGPGLENIHAALATAGGTAPDAAAITRAGLGGGDTLAREVLELFFAFLGTAASDLALATGARGGVNLAGGILPRFVDAPAFDGLSARFLARFVDKGRFQNYLAANPVRLITHPYPAFIGLRHLIVA